jgi:hypothetical protein
VRRRVVRLLTRRWCPLRAVVLLLLLLVVVRGSLVRVCAAAVRLRSSELVRTGLLLLGRVLLSGGLVWAGMLLRVVFLSGELVRPGLWVPVRELVGCRRGRRHGHRGSGLLGVGCRLG